MDTNKLTMTEIEKLFAATRYRAKKKPNVPKTCQTCKHWGDDIERKTESLDPLTRECKEIFKRLTDSNDLEGYLPFFDSLATPATFGCNEYGQAKDSL
jgi:hypothetical protein